jgi:NADPH:quinone reductase-like Zn-dependent oxidoreductase
MNAVKPRKRRRFWKIAILALFGVLSVGFAMLWFDEPDPLTNRESGESMQAIVYHGYGPPEVLRLETVKKLLPNDDQVLIKVRAAAVNPLDWHYMRGTPYVMRLDAGLRKPHDPRLGVDMAGEIEAVGSQVTQFKPGDRVFGVAPGSFAGYALASPKRIAPMPAGTTFEQAAAVPVAAITALQGLRDKGKLRAGQKVLINGASGGVGTFAVQIAHAFGAEVTGVCSTRNVEMVRALGADHVIDYKQEDFTQGIERYDLVLDNVGIHPLSALRSVLKPQGILVLVGGGGPDAGNWIGPLARPLKALGMSPFVDQEMSMLLANVNPDDLLLMNEMIESGKVKPVIDRTYGLSEVPEAIRYLEEGHARGKVIITMAHESRP